MQVTALQFVNNVMFLCILLLVLIFKVCPLGQVMGKVNKKLTPLDRGGKQEVKKET